MRLILLLLIFEAADFAFQTPDGFKDERAVEASACEFPMFATFDDKGRLFVAESSGLDLYAELSGLTRKCRVRLLEDRDGDGKFERSRVFADELVFPMGLAWRDGKLYVADPPNLITIEDINGDGRGDKRTVILSKFGHKDNGSLHGLVFGPDGWLYLTTGSPDGYRFNRPDGSVLEGESGALIRCRADGSGAEVLARGFENLVEVVFTPDWEIIGTDNWFRWPEGGVRDALVHLARRIVSNPQGYGDATADHGRASPRDRVVSGGGLERLDALWGQRVSGSHAREFVFGATQRAQGAGACANWGRLQLSCRRLRFCDC